ncbi:UNVERIFIED_CONTAM: Translocon-associated protein subunit alpha [Sesamum radiatum]|uniref:Translocon-associated protein subunit alpha n=1 Tax=Sesamum radiatum TaxID=300843 RepID=A0AAW2S396_SESRA
MHENFDLVLEFFYGFRVLLYFDMPDDGLDQIEFLFSPFLVLDCYVTRCEPDPDAEVVDSSEDGGDLGLLGRMSKILVVEALVQLQEWKLFVFSPKTPQNAFRNASVPPSAQATFPYIFAVSKFLQPGEFDLVGTIVYEIDQNPYQSTFYNGTVEVTEVGGLFSVESVFLFCLGVALLGLLGVWIRSQIQNLSKKTKRVTKVEVGTAKTDASMDEWLQETGPKGFGQQQLRNLILLVFPRILGNRHAWDQGSQPLRSRDSCLRCVHQHHTTN